MDLCAVAFSIFNAGSHEDGIAVVADTGEPILKTMSPDLNGLQKSSPPSISAYELWQLQLQKRKLREEYLDHWEATVKETGTNRPVDAIISPVAPFAAPPHGKYT